MVQLVSIFLSLLMFSMAAKADVVSEFKSLSDNRKGAFELNYLQGSEGRVPVRDNKQAPGTFQFQAAFRNPEAKALAAKYDFYIGNLFTTNYYELMGEFVFGDAFGSHEVNPSKLLAVASNAHGKASAMVRSWVLEKHYVSSFPSSSLATGFGLRGISGSEFEQTYAKYFFDFYLSSMSQEFEFLPIYLLSKGSPLVDSNSLDRARTDIAKLYESVKTRLGDKHNTSVALWKLRNSIHNQLTQAVIGQIDQFLNSQSDLSSDEKNTLVNLQSSLKSYYSISASRVAELAAQAGAGEIQNLAQALSGGYNVQTGLALSNALANLRSQTKNTAQLVLISTASRYLNKQLSEISSVTSKDALLTVVNLIYVEGFLIKDNWQYFVGEVNSAANIQTASQVLVDIVGIANDTLLTAFKPSLAQWISVEPKMQNFVDNTIKSSALSTASTLKTKIGN
jgi:hypothetical protein